MHFYCKTATQRQRVDNKLSHTPTSTASLDAPFLSLLRVIPPTSWRHSLRNDYCWVEIVYNSRNSYLLPWYFQLYVQVVDRRVTSASVRCPSSVDTTPLPHLCCHKRTSNMNPFSSRTSALYRGVASPQHCSLGCCVLCSVHVMVTFSLSALYKQITIQLHSYANDSITRVLYQRTIMYNRTCVDL